jgi:hypothetical protein
MGPKHKGSWKSQAFQPDTRRSARHSIQSYDAKGVGAAGMAEGIKA